MESIKKNKNKINLQKKELKSIITEEELKKKKKLIIVYMMA